MDSSPLKPPRDSVVVRVGADSVRTRRGVRYVFPVIELIYPQGDQLDCPLDLRVVWSTREWGMKSTKGGKHLTLVADSHDGKEHVGFITYRPSPKDKKLFEELREMWGMWFLRIRHYNGDNWHLTVANDGTVVEQDFLAFLQRAVLTCDSTKLSSLLFEGLDKSLRVSPHQSNVSESTVALAKTEEGLQKIYTCLHSIIGIMEGIGGPLPWSPWSAGDGKVPKQTHNLIMANYFLLLEQLYLGKERGKTKDIRQESAKIWAKLRDAHIFEISAMAYARVYHEVMSGSPHGTRSRRKAGQRSGKKESSRPSRYRKPAKPSPTPSISRSRPAGSRVAAPRSP